MHSVMHALKLATLLIAVRTASGAQKKLPSWYKPDTTCLKCIEIHVRTQLIDSQGPGDGVAEGLVKDLYDVFDGSNKEGCCNKCCDLVDACGENAKEWFEMLLDERKKTQKKKDQEADANKGKDSEFIKMLKQDILENPMKKLITELECEHPYLKDAKNRVQRYIADKKIDDAKKQACNYYKSIQEMVDLGYQLQQKRCTSCYNLVKAYYGKSNEWYQLLAETEDEKGLNSLMGDLYRKPVDTSIPHETIETARSQLTSFLNQSTPQPNVIETQSDHQISGKKIYRKAPRKDWDESEGKRTWACANCTKNVWFGGHTCRVCQKFIHSKCQGKEASKEIFHFDQKENWVCDSCQGSYNWEQEPDLPEQPAISNNNARDRTWSDLSDYSHSYNVDWNRRRLGIIHVNQVHGRQLAETESPLDSLPLVAGASTVIYIMWCATKKFLRQKKEN